MDVERETNTYWDDEKGPILISNFKAEITKEFKYIDGKKTTRIYSIDGQLGNEDLETIMVPAEEFSSMGWVQMGWGSRVIIYPKSGAKELLRTKIQIESNPKTIDIYTHIGWTRIKKKDIYLSTNCCLEAKKRTTDINVLVPDDLRRYSFPRTNEKSEKESIDQSLMLVRLGPPEIAWMLLGATYRSAISSCDFTIHITGRTGTYKSELAAIYQSHFGVCTARELPASWSSTANAIEALAYRAKNALMVCDDFIPSGTSWQVKSYQKTADQIIRSQGNQAGRARLTDRSMLQETMYPRGLILSTGEDTPEGHSVRGRMMIAELSPDDIDLNELTRAQGSKEWLNESMALYIQWLAEDLKEKQNEAKDVAIQLRDEHISIGHARTPSTIAEIITGCYMFLKFSEEKKVISVNECNRLYGEACIELKKLAGRQLEYIKAADPADQFLQILRGILAANAGHIKGMQGGIPRDAAILGWTTIGPIEDMEYKAHGPRIGWVSEADSIIYLDATVSYDTIRRHSRGAITITRATLYKRLREAGYLAKTDETRQRNTVRIQLEGASRNVLAIHKTTLTEGEKDET